MSLPAKNVSTETRDLLKFWRKGIIIGLGLLIWAALIGIAFWFLGLIAYPILIVIISIIVAYLLFPLVKLLQRYIPTIIAITLTYLLVLVGLMLIAFGVILTALTQLFSMVERLLKSWPNIVQHLEPLTDMMKQAGVDPSTFQVSGSQLIQEALGAINKILPLAFSLFSLAISAIIITSLSVYFILDGPRVAHWLRTSTPNKQRRPLASFLSLANTMAGKIIRGQILVATITTAIMAIGLFFFGVPYVMLLALIIFLFEFIPQIGSYISAAIVVLVAFLTKDWQIALLVAIFSGIVQGGIDGQILIPRILGKAVGLHPIVSVFALLVGATLFGLPGVLFATPVAGFAQILLASWWRSWKQSHPEEFANKPAEEKNDQQ